MFHCLHDYPYDYLAPIMDKFLSDFCTCTIYSIFEAIYCIFVSASGDDFQPQKLHSYIDIEQIENEFVLTSAEYLLSLAHVKWRFTGKTLYFILFY